jgi:TatD DNase family protein
MIKYIYDSHCHLEYIETLSHHQNMAIIPGVNLKDAAKLVELRKQYPIYKIGFGLHPWFIDDYMREQQTCTLTKLTQEAVSFRRKPESIIIKKQLVSQELSLLIRANKPDFIGEIGLDKYKDNFERQIEIFELQLCVAKEFSLPVIIHCVKAYNEVLSIIKKYNINRGIIHGFNANEKIAREFYTQGLLLGIGANITKASLIARSIKNIPVQYIVLESDAPYMPAFGQPISTSADCFLYAQVLSHIKNINLIDVITQSNQNVINLCV